MFGRVYGMRHRAPGMRIAVRGKGARATIGTRYRPTVLGSVETSSVVTPRSLRGTPVGSSLRVSFNAHTPALHPRDVTEHRANQTHTRESAGPMEEQLSDSSAVRDPTS